ncbi:hypothetical protein [Roseateles sp. LYH14W]|uniref:DUF302 domain-containing protein n=1 Tax=Pelomonas parva TaxID=3299032 RepID=A0ABW7FA62_9BURK
MHSTSLTKALSLPLALGTLLLLTSTATLAGPSESMCSLLEDGMRGSLQLSGIEPVHSVQAQDLPGGGQLHVLTCAWVSKAQDRSLTITSTTGAIPIEMPVSCNEQKAGDKSMVMCMAGSGGPMVTVVLTQPLQNGNPNLAAALRAHTEVMVKKWGKLAKRP